MLLPVWSGSEPGAKLPCVARMVSLMLTHQRVSGSASRAVIPGMPQAPVRHRLDCFHSQGLEDFVHELNDHRPLANSRGNALDRSRAHITCCEHAETAGFQKVRLSSCGPA